MRVYLAARFARRFEMQGCRADLQRLGHSCVSRWIDIGTEGTGDAYSRRCAEIDIEDIRDSDAVIGFQDVHRTTHSRGGHFWEEGFAYALGRRLIIVGDRSHVFHYLPVEHFPTWRQCLARGVGAAAESASSVQ